jgi:hypothetical protein
MLEQLEVVALIVGSSIATLRALVYWERQKQPRQPPPPQLVSPPKPKRLRSRGRQSWRWSSSGALTLNRQGEIRRSNRER